MNLRMPTGVNGLDIVSNYRGTWIFCQTVFCYLKCYFLVSFFSQGAHFFFQGEGVGFQSKKGQETKIKLGLPLQLMAITPQPAILSPYLSITTDGNHTLTSHIKPIPVHYD